MQVRVWDQIVFGLSRRDPFMAAPADPAGLSCPTDESAAVTADVEYCFSERQLIKLARIPSHASEVFRPEEVPHAAQEHGFSGGRSNTHSIHL